MAGPAPGESRQFDEHIAWTEEPDVFAMQLAGEVDGPPLGALLTFQSAWAEGKSHVFILCDLSRVRGATTEARRVLQATRIPRGALTHVCFGASFSARVFADMVVRAARFLGKTPPGMEVVFFAEEPEARAYIEHTRRMSQRRRR